MEDPAKISVVVPVFRAQAYLNNCVESILGQTYKNLEIILVDDKSPDDCWTIMQGYAARDKRVKIYSLPQNRGVAAARNFAIERVTGDFVAFVDADDSIEPTMLERMLSCAQSNDAEIVLCQYDHYKDEKHYQPRNTLRQATALLAQAPRTPTELYPIFYQLGVVLWRGLFSMDLIRRYNEPFPPLGACEDDYWHTFYRLRARKIAAINEVFYHYRSHPLSLSNTQRQAHALPEVLRRIESVNGEFLKNPAFLKSYEHYKVDSLCWHVHSIFKKISPEKKIERVMELKELLKDVRVESRRLKAFAKLFQRNSPKEILQRLAWRSAAQRVGRTAQMVFKVRISSKERLAYARVLGVTFNFSKLVFA